MDPPTTPVVVAQSRGGERGPLINEPSTNARVSLSPCLSLHAGRRARRSNPLSIILPIINHSSTFFNVAAPPSRFLLDARRRRRRRLGCRARNGRCCASQRRSRIIEKPSPRDRWIALTSTSITIIFYDRRNEIASERDYICLGYRVDECISRSTPLETGDYRRLHNGNLIEIIISFSRFDPPAMSS